MPKYVALYDVNTRVLVTFEADNHIIERGRDFHPRPELQHEALKARLVLAQWDDLKATAETIVAAHESSGKAYRWACKVLETYDAEHQA